MVGRVKFSRMALVPSTKKDINKYQEIGGDGLIFPVDDALGLNRLPFKMTVATMLTVAEEALVLTSYEEAQRRLKTKMNIDINDDTIRQVTNVLGSLVFENDKKMADELWADMNDKRHIIYNNKINEILYLEVDGAMVPTRKDDHKGIVYKENKLGMAFSTDNFLRWKDKHGQHKHQILKREYISTIGDSTDFTKLMYMLALKNGYGKYKTNVLISDGATWIRNMKNYIFPDFQQIFDFFYLKKHVSDFAKEIFYKDEEKYNPWAEEVTEIFKKGSYDEAIKLIKSSIKPKFNDLLEKLITYFRNNKDNMDYPTYLKKGYFIGSGAIESSNKTVMQRRLKYGASRWNLLSGQAVLSLMVKYKSDLWDSEVVNATYQKYGEPIPLPLLKAS
jgi:hypothetical protein